MLGGRCCWSGLGRWPRGGNDAGVPPFPRVAVRGHVGDDITFMVDANYSMSVDQAIAAAQAFKPYDLTWFEDPEQAKPVAKCERQN